MLHSQFLCLAKAKKQKLSLAHLDCDPGNWSKFLKSHIVLSEAVGLHLERN